SSARAIAGAEPSSDWTTTMFCACMARRPNCASTASSNSRGSLRLPRSGRTYRGRPSTSRLFSSPSSRMSREIVACVTSQPALRDRRTAAGEAMSKADLLVERGADRLEGLSRKAAAKGGFAAKLADELAEDAAFLRKLKPSLIKARAQGRTPVTPAPARKPQ